MRFSIVIPTYNYARFLSRAIDSAVAQCGHDYEVVVVDDGSTDDTAAIVERYTQQADKVRYVAQENKGVSAARNRGAKESRGEYLLFLDADDELLSGALAEFRDALAHSQDAKLICGGSETKDVRGKRKIYPGPSFTGDSARDFVLYATRRISVPMGAALIARSVFGLLGFPESIKNDEDMVFFSHVILSFVHTSFISPVVLIHKHDDSLRHETEQLIKQSPERFANAAHIPPAVRQRLLQATDLLFDKKILPDRLMKLRKRFTARKYLSGFRMYYEAGRYTEARTLFHEAVREYPLSALELGYLKRYVRSLLGLAA